MPVCRCKINPFLAAVAACGTVKVSINTRIGLVKDADKIIILKDGRIAEMGTHDELLKNKGYYYEVFTLQNEGFGKEAV